MLFDIRHLAVYLRPHGRRYVARFLVLKSARFYAVLSGVRQRTTQHLMCSFDQSVDGQSTFSQRFWFSNGSPVRRRSNFGARRRQILNEEGGKSLKWKDLNDSGDELSSMPLAVEMMAKNNASVEPSLQSQSLSESSNRSLEIDARLAELEQLAAIKIRDVDHAVELEADLINNRGITDSELYDNISELNHENQFLLPVTHQPGKTVQLYGSPDPNVPPSITPCHGCGVHLHCIDPGVAGYIPSQLFVATSPTQLKDILCQRCYLLDRFNIAIDVTVKPMDFQAIAEQIKKTSPALLLVLVDLTDLPNSFYDSFTELAGENRPVYIIGNKVDLLPRDDAFYLKRIKESVAQLCAERGVPVEHVALISAKTGYGIENLISQLLRDWRLKGQVYILGCTNAGKSSLFNALLTSDFCRIAARDIIQRATSSLWPGTTLSLLKFPIVNPKPVRLYQRIERLKKQQSEDREEEKLRRAKLNETGHSKYATLMGYIGQTSPSPQKAALEKYIDERHKTGFVAPSYSFEEDDSEGVNGKTDSWLQDYVGRDTILNHMRIKVAPYDDSTFKFWCYDTPGIINPNQVINYLNTDELLVLSNKTLIIPRTFRLKQSHVLFVSGLGRLDYIEGDDSIYCTVFAAESIPIHVKSLEESNEFYRSNIGTSALGVPLGDRDRLNMIPPLAGRQFELRGIGWKESMADVVLSSIGWVSITARPDCVVRLEAFTPGGGGCVVRTPSLLKYAVNLRGKRIRGTYSYHVRSPKFCSNW